MLYRFVFNPYQVNTYIIADQDGKCIIVDPACCSPEEQKTLVELIEKEKLTPEWLINTHGHFDHVIGNAFVCHTWKVKTAACYEDLMLMENAYRQGEIFGFPVEQPPTPEVDLKEGDFSMGNIHLHIYHVPGHSPGSIVLHSPSDKWLICGDVLFNGSIGRTDLIGGNFDTLIENIKSKLLVLPPETMVYPGHGPETSIGQEILHNPFLNGR